MKLIAKAVIAVMKSVKGIDKTMTIGSGSNSYKGVPDKEVKKVIGDAMAANGLCLLPTSCEAKTQVDRWEETGGQYGPKQKQSVFTEVTTKYLLLHESGESIELAGYGHGVDSQDKSAGKATTYALKYALLYTFLVPTGKIDDSDTEHSENMPVPAASKAVKAAPWHLTAEAQAELVGLIKNSTLDKVNSDLAATEIAAAKSQSRIDQIKHRLLQVQTPSL